MHSGERCREVSLNLGGKTVIWASVETPTLGNVAVKQNHNQIQHPSDTTSNKAVFEEQKDKRYDAFIVHEFSTGNSTAFKIKKGLACFNITAFVAPQDVTTGADEESTRQSH